jgi:ribose transport system ATP-binding protein
VTTEQATAPRDTREPMSTAPFITAESIAKSFGVVRALRDVSLEIERGQVHGLVGANGAGKSTFLNVVGGVIQPDSGRLLVDGEETSIADPRQAAERGFAFIHQELALVPQFSAIDNMTIGMRPETPLGLGDTKRRRAAALAVAERLDLRFRLDRPVKDLSVAERGMVAIGRALVGEARFVSMDEPTASLSDIERDRLFAIIRTLSADGVAIAYVSHRLDEIEELCDAVTVFKEGTVVGRFERGGYTRDDLILGITGTSTLAEADAALPDEASDTVQTPIVLEVEHLAREPRVKDVSFQLRRGEILGLAGVVGAGRTETVRLIFGADRADSGTMRLDGKTFSPRSIADAIVKGMALVPEERRSQALAMDDSIAENISMGAWHANRSWPFLPFTSDQKATTLADRMMTSLGIKARNSAAPVKTLSGGNQQKVVFARWLSRDSRVLLLDEPTRGVDVGARKQIWDTAEQFARAGGSVVVICSELEELAVCHRVVVIVEGRDVEILPGPGVSEERMLESIFTHTTQLKETTE